MFYDSERMQFCCDTPEEVNLLGGRASWGIVYAGALVNRVAGLSMVTISPDGLTPAEHHVASQQLYELRGAMADVIAGAMGPIIARQAENYLQQTSY